MSSFNGVGTALITPFTDGGALDEAALAKFVDWQITEGVNFLVPCGTTGENPTLTASQLKDRPRGDVWIHRDESGGLGRESCALWNGRGVAGAVTGPSGASRTSRTWWTAGSGW